MLEVGSRIHDLKPSNLELGSFPYHGFHSAEYVEKEGMVLV